MKRVVEAGSVVFTLALLLVATAPAARAPTYLEKVTIMDAFNRPGRSWPSQCMKILVSTVDLRYALVTSRGRAPRACVRNNDVGNGYDIFRRATPTALHWRLVTERAGLEPGPCSMPAAVRKDLLGSTTCRR